MTYWYRGVQDTIQLVKRVFPQTPVVLGGIYATLCPEHAKKHSGADFIITGDGKIPVLKIADSLSGSKRNYNEVRTTLDVLPYPSYHLYKQLNSVSMISSLGCPYDCTYCASRQLQPLFQERSPHNVFEEIQYYHMRFNVHDIAFYDDAFLVNAAIRFIPLFNTVARSPLDIRFHLPNGLHIKYITQEIADLLFACNFKTVRLSFESSSKRIQRDSSLKATNKNLKDAQKYLRQAGYNNKELEVYLMVGLPGQTHEEVIKAIHFVHDLDLKIKVVQYSPIPHTLDYEKVVEQYGFADIDPLVHNNTVFPFYILDKGYEELQDIKHTVVELNNALVG
jgi:radical SAM superfamily enzyme YgiQ (UPF0313 family)